MKTKRMINPQLFTTFMYQWVTNIDIHKKYHPEKRRISILIRNIKELTNLYLDIISMKGIGILIRKDITQIDFKRLTMMVMDTISIMVDMGIMNIHCILP